MISVLISVALMAGEPADLLRRSNACSSGSCSVSVSKEVTTIKTVETKTCTPSKKRALRCNRISKSCKSCR